MPDLSDEEFEEMSQKLTPFIYGLGIVLALLFTAVCVLGVVALAKVVF